MAMEQEEERLIKLKDEAYSTLPEGWNNLLKTIELYKENNKIWVEKEDLNKELNDLVERAKVILGPKETITNGVEKITREDLAVENRKLHDRL